ncbi:MAG: asparagine synthetase B, partial [Myxococcales bacterium]
RYWAPSFAPRHNLPIAEARSELRERMKVIVRDRLDADVPVGAFLSGGLDSATVVGVATRDLGRTVHTYSIGFADKTMDESADARLSARHLGSIHEEFIVSEADLPSVEMLVAHHDGPFGDSSALPTYLVSKLAREHVTVAVTGDGGDEVFGGYPRFLGAQLGELVPAWAGSAGRQLVGGLRQLGLGGDPSGRTHLARAGRFAAAIERPLEHKLLHWTSYFAPGVVPSLLRPEVAVEAAELMRPSDLVFGDTVGQSTLARTLHHNFQTYLPDDLLVKVDRCSMAVSLETRSPLLDSGLIDFVGSLPDSYKTRGLTTKRLLRETFADLLAPDLLKRPKRGFGVPLWTWFDNSLKPLLDDTVRSADARLYRYLDRDRVHALLWPTPKLDAPRAGQAWCLVTLELWLRQVGL